MQLYKKLHYKPLMIAEKRCSGLRIHSKRMTRKPIEKLLLKWTNSWTTETAGVDGKYFFLQKLATKLK